MYRVLTQFEQAGICIRHNFEEGHAVYELTPSDHHDHMVCLDTGDVIEFTDDIIEERQKKLASFFCLSSMMSSVNSITSPVSRHTIWS